MIINDKGSPQILHPCLEKKSVNIACGMLKNNHQKARTGRIMFEPFYRKKNITSVSPRLFSFRKRPNSTKYPNINRTYLILSDDAC